MVELSEVIDNTLSKIAGLRAPLSKVSEESEPIFLNLGTSLQEIFAGAEDLTELTRETARLVDGESNDNILGNIGEFSRDSLKRLNTCREDVSNVLPKVEICSSNLKRLHDMCPVIRTIAKKLNIVALHISMESSRSRQCEEMFNFFVQEIKALATKVNQISRKISDDSEMAKSRQIADFASITEKKDRLSSLADSAKGSVEDNINHIEELVKMSLDVLRIAEIHSQKISSLVGEIVVAIQFHDISRQQIEHIVENLEDIRTFFDEDTGNEKSSNGDKTGALSKAYMVLSLQVEQINQVKKEITNAYIKTKRSFTEIGKEVEAIVNGMININQNTDNSGNSSNTFQQLISGLCQLEDIMSHGKEMAKIIDHALKESAETAESLGGHLTQMEDISMDLHIKAINALIMSKRLGAEGKTLSVLAEDVTEVSLDSNAFVLDVVEILKAIGGLATKLACLSDNESDIESEVLPQANSFGTERLTAVYEDFIKKTAYSFDHLKGLKNKILRLEADLESLREIEASLTIQEKNITSIIDEIRPMISGVHHSKKDLEYLRERYTMEVERGIHNRVLKANSGQEKVSHRYEVEKTLPGNEMDESSLGDNIELF